MYRKRKISFYFPCRNEANHLREEVERLPSFLDEIIVISNKSTDDTVLVANKLNLITIVDDRVKKGIGYGFAHMSGLARASGDIIVTADADGTYPINKLDEILDYLIDNDIEFLSCNRYPLKERDQIGWILQMGVKILNLEVNILYSLGIKDILSGMWLVTKEAKDKLKPTEGDWNLSPELKLQAALNPNIKFAEYHIETNSRRGRTKQQYLKTGLRHLFWIFKNRFKFNSK